MGISRWFYRFTDEHVNSILPEEKPRVDEVKKDPEITFESDKEVIEKCRYVKAGGQVIGYLVTKDGKWEWLQIKEECGLSYKIDIIKQLSMEKMIAITEKLKELNGCSALNNKYAKQQMEAFNRMCK